jgi:FKBP-type peptidyl-prolyl cis-trans isomerase 2
VGKEIVVEAENAAVKGAEAGKEREVAVSSDAAPAG